MKAKIFTIAAVNAAILALGSSAWAQTSGTPPGPNVYGNVDPSQSTYTQTTVGPGAGSDMLTLALDVFPRVSGLAPNNPLPTASGTGVYGVTTGLGGDGRSTWVYGFEATSSLNLTYNYTLTVVNEANGLSATYNPAAIGDNKTAVGVSGTSFGNEESLDFTLTAPGFFGAIGYDPTANDTYIVTLSAKSLLTGGQVASDSIEVISGTGVPDASSTLPLLGAALTGLALVGRKFKKA